MVGRLFHQKRWGICWTILSCSDLGKSIGILRCGILLGVSDADIAFTLNRLVEIGGGFVVVTEGRVVEELPMPIGGIISEEPVPKLARSWSE